MKSIRLLSAVEQVASYLENLILKGHIKGEISGVARLSKELGANTKTVASALQVLEREGILINQGPRRKRLVDTRKISLLSEESPKQISFGILAYEPSDRSTVFFMELMHTLADYGYSVRYAKKTLTELKMDLESVQELVKREDFGAWLVFSGSREILEWFSQQRVSVFALSGRRKGLRMPAVGPNSSDAFLEALDHLIAVGHRKIVKICRSERRLPTPGFIERLFLDRLNESGIPVGTYNLPHWNETRTGFQELLESLFRVTSPTVLIFDEPAFLVPVMQFLGERGIRVPQDLSLMFMAPDAQFEWSDPVIACLDWKTAPLTRRILKWANNVTEGRDDFEQTLTPASFRIGGTIGPASG